MVTSPATAPEQAPRMLGLPRSSHSAPAHDSVPAAVAKALETAPDSVFAEENPAEGRFKEMFPQKGGAITFLCIGHMQMHLGQVSTWRRVMGLGSAT